MEALAIYLIKSVLCTAFFLGIYWCFLKKETFYRFNRHFLLLGLIGSIVFPFYTYTYQANGKALNNLLPNEGIPIMTNTTGSIWLYIIGFAYIIGACFLLIRHLVGLSRIKRTISRDGYTSLPGYKLVKSSAFKSSFSVFNYIIIDNSSEETSEKEKELILEHELAHVKQFHWVDLLVSQVFCTVQWFNPFAWLYVHAIKENHEFLADQTVLQQGNSAAVYRAALINHSLGTPVFSFASSFSRYDKLKRVQMMMKPASSSIKKLAVIIVFPALALFLWAFAKPKFTNHPPLMYVDGVEVNSMSHIKPDDIESIQVLKDTAAKATYGKKAEYDVILISLKKHIQ